ncbi:DNA-binding protein [Corynebacterium sp. 320]|uniref:DNA-binding protein n=1 Tax=Corynebacterium TaxID=1716 RepID=UPI00125CC848|nr:MULTISPECIES: DNA-binding protein [Corynebacterium]KAB1503649.1 DNA-binding protein [Corynebacterium sp. 320]KAB1553250.1 DNA-binding protein [Corynebacterium sp. 321]KAB1553531.1 DNA-binding protein [Corynebacterium sp. 319]KAB3527785.1 DNA-binding protein [Corynebacterium sp. 250]KAB3540726.1 DNA-binding protein [Corynebacterium sp. 366]
MFAIHASYRGRSRRRAAYVRDIVHALSQSAAVLSVDAIGVEDFVCLSDNAEHTGGLVLSLLQAGDFAIGIGVIAGAESQLNEYYDSVEEIHQHLKDAAQRTIQPSLKATHVAVRVEMPGPGAVVAPGYASEVADDVVSAFTLLAHVLARRTKEGREATALLRSGLSQSEAAAEVGISKQAMSQRLAAAGWQAEQAGWNLAIHMLARVEQLQSPY